MGYESRVYIMKKATLQKDLRKKLQNLTAGE